MALLVTKIPEHNLDSQGTWLASGGESRLGVPAYSVERRRPTSSPTNLSVNLRLPFELR